MVNSFPSSVAVVIPTYNRAHCIGIAVDSVLAQSHPADEVIVVDDGSIDDTRDVVGQYGPRIRYLHRPNAGVSAARNAGVREARSAWIAFLDSDDEWHPDKLALQISELRRHPEAVAHMVDCAVGGWASGAPSIFDARGLTGEFQARPLRTRPLRAVLASAFFPSGWVVRRSAITDAAFFDEQLRVCEDTDLLSRIALAGPFVVSCFRGAALERRAGTEGLSAIFTKSPQTYFRSMARSYGRLLQQSVLAADERRFVAHELASIHVELALLLGRDGGRTAMREPLLTALQTSLSPATFAKALGLLALGSAAYLSLLEKAGRRQAAFRRSAGDPGVST